MIRSKRVVQRGVPGECQERYKRCFSRIYVFSRSRSSFSRSGMITSKLVRELSLTAGRYVTRHSQDDIVYG